MSVQEVSLWQDEKFLTDTKTLLSLIYLAGGKIKRYSRLQISMYAVKGQTLKLHSYAFTGTCTAGPADAQFLDDVHILCGYVLFDYYTDTKGTKHAIYSLSQGAMELAAMYVKQIEAYNPLGYARLKRVAEMVGKDPEDTPSSVLHNAFVINDPPLD